jgi:predicted transcriptional regulator
LQVHQLFNEDATIKRNFEVKEQKTSKKNTITITPKVKETLESYYSMYENIIKD